MASPRQKCGYIGAVSDVQVKCERCQDNGIGTDPCVLNKDCEICDSLTAEQKIHFATATYKSPQGAQEDC